MQDVELESSIGKNGQIDHQNIIMQRKCVGFIESTRQLDLGREESIVIVDVEAIHQLKIGHFGRGGASIDLRFVAESDISREIAVLI